MRARSKQEISIGRQILPYAIRAGLVYLVLLVFVPAIAYAFVLFSGKNTLVENIVSLYLLLSNFLKVVSGWFGQNIYLFPSPADFLLAAIAVLYHRKWKISAGLLVAAGLVYLFGQFVGDLLAQPIGGLGPTSAGALTIEIVYSAFALLLIGSYLFAPTFFAYSQKKANKVLYLVLNAIVGWIPPAWILLVFFSTKPAKTKAPEKSEAPAAKPEPKPVHKRELKKKKGFKKK